MSTADTVPETFQDTDPAEPLAPWFGGKRYLAQRIIKRIDAVPHACYAEPFSGMGGVFFRRAKKPKSEILNDINGDITNLFRMVREHPDEITRQFRCTLSSRREFARLCAVPPETLTDIQRAARFAFLQRLTFGGKPANHATPGQTGMASPHHPARLTADKMRRLISAAHKRLQGVHIRIPPLASVHHPIRQTPSPLFYIDPPYWGHEHDYGKGLFERQDFTRMAGIPRQPQRQVHPLPQRYPRGPGTVQEV